MKIDMYKMKMACQMYQWTPYLLGQAALKKHNTQATRQKNQSQYNGYRCYNCFNRLIWFCPPQTASLPSGPFWRRSSAMRTLNSGWRARTTRKTRVQPSWCPKQTRSIWNSLMSRPPERYVYTKKLSSWTNDYIDQINFYFSFKIIKPI